MSLSPIKRDFWPWHMCFFPKELGCDLKGEWPKAKQWRNDTYRPIGKHLESDAIRDHEMGPIFWESNLIQTYGRFERFPPKKMTPIYWNFQIVVISYVIDTICWDFRKLIQWHPSPVLSADWQECVRLWVLLHAGGSSISFVGGW